ncbi:hypothetical protein [Streptomyces nigrescens]|uniref:hypothetical protein n=1 Tax=Streptomyces nigrescens TaxID=1920 RepID=UPI00224E158F|nr:hypothetical protein [Streptomyces libani]MCX5445347.1 hypothetical protein [Streptomyces libani]
MTPYSLAFYLNVVTSGTVLGAQPADTPDQVTKALGTDYAENSPNGSQMWRDYGLTEFFWERASAEHPWTGHHFTLQVHRLARGGGKVAGERLRSRYGRFDRRLRFEKLRRLLERRGTPLVEIPEPPVQAPYYRTYWQPASRVSVSVIRAHGEYVTPDTLRIGDVYHILAPMTPEEVDWRTSRQWS